MAIKFDTSKFKEQMEKKNSNNEKTTNSINDDISFSSSELDFINGTFKKKELKKRYNLSLKPTTNRTLLIESRRRGISKSELVEELILQKFKSKNKGE